MGAEEAEGIERRGGGASFESLPLARRSRFMNVSCGR